MEGPVLNVGRVRLMPALVLVAAWLLSCGSALAADAAGGQRKAQACAVCHGPLGVATAPDAPNLAGQNELYVVTQLRNFRSGRRPHEVMAVMARPLTDEDIADLAAWYASIVVEVRPR